MIDLNLLRQKLFSLPKLPWTVWTSNSFRRITSHEGGDGDVLSGTIQRADNHPDLSMNARDLNSLVNVMNSVPALLTELGQLLGIFSDYEAPCESYEQARKIWDFVRNREIATERMLKEAKGYIEKLEEEHSKGLAEMQELCSRDGLGVTGESVKELLIEGYKKAVEERDEVNRQLDDLTVLCKPCSEAGGAGLPIKHLPPVCD
jgi:hypothetical protein